MADKNIPHTDGKPHGENNEPKPRKEKKRRRRPGLVLFLILLIVILCALIWFFRDGFGLGGGSGSGQSGTNNDSSGTPSAVTSDTTSSAPDKNLEITEIRIVENDIYIGSEKCADENDLKDKLTALGREKKYKLIHDTAIKETYDKVKAVLLELKDSLDLDISFNE